MDSVNFKFPFQERVDQLTLQLGAHPERGVQALVPFAKAGTLPTSWISYHFARTVSREQEMKQLEQLGEGARGCVVSIDYGDGPCVAKIERAKENEQFWASSCESDLSFDHEIQMLAELSGILGVVQLIGVMPETVEDIPKGSLILERAENGSLAQYVLTHDLDEGEVRFLARDLIEALANLHSRRMVHRDIKPHNILVSREGKALLADFDKSCLLDLNQETISQGPTGLGTYKYMPPESKGDGIYNPMAADIWQMGCVLCYLATKGESLPFDHPEKSSDPIPYQLRLFTNQASFNGDPITNTALRTLIKRMVDPDPAKRPTATEILADDFFEPSRQANLPSEKTQVGQ